MNNFLSDSVFVSDVLPAVNYGDRLGEIDILLFHYTGMSDSGSALNWLRCEESGVSCHYFIYEDGRIIQLLPESVRAHHAGESYWGGVRDINSHSIGIELANAGHSADVLPEFPRVQMESLRDLSRDIIVRHNIRSERILGHSDVSPFRKRDPGELFDWSWLHSEGIGHYVSVIDGSDIFCCEGDDNERVTQTQQFLRNYGYDCIVDGMFGDRTRLVIESFQRHFRSSCVDGVVDISTFRTLEDLFSTLS